jgi:hypothetical protein
MTCLSARSRISYRWLSSFLLVFSLTAGAEESPGGKEPSFRLFESTATLDAVLQLPWQAMVTDEFFYQGGYPSHFEVTDEQGQSISIALDTERRGMSRQVICRYPPIKLRFPENAVEGTLFEGQKSLKLVTHCDKSKASEQYQVLEALAYRMYNQVSDFSFRVRPLSVTYIDSDTGKPDGPRFAFLIESDGEVAKRNGQKKIKLAAIGPERLEALEASKLSLFQYMIGNTGWSLQRKANDEECCDNLKLIGQGPDEGPIYAIPNDFDSSGLVNAHYAKPAKNLNITDVTERVFLGFCAHNEKLHEARKRFLEKQTEILSLVNDEQRLADDVKERTLVFLGQFFNELSEPELFRKHITSSCRS